MEHSSGAGEPRKLDEVRLVDLLVVLIRRWKTVAAVSVGVVCSAVVVTLARPDRYVAETVLVPASIQSGSRLQSVTAQLPVGFPGLSGGDGNEELVRTIARSRSLSDSVIAMVSTQPVGRRLGDALVRSTVEQQTQIEQQSGGTVHVTVEATDPQLAFRIASAYPVVINGIFAALARQAAVHRSKFLEEQLQEQAEHLEASEQALVRFQKSADVPEVQDQAKRTVEVAASLQQKILEKEVDLAQLRRIATTANPELRAKEAEIAALRRQLSSLTSSQPVIGGVLVPLKRSSDLQVNSVRLLRDFTKDEQIYNSLTAALADAQIDARKDFPVLAVLDPATVPAAPHQASLLMVLLLSLTAGIVLGTVAAFLREYGQRVLSEPGGQELDHAWTQLKIDLSGGALHRRRRRDGASRRELPL